MIDYRHALAGGEVLVHFVEHPHEPAERQAVYDFVARNRVVGVDTETTGGFAVYLPGYGLRLLQVGSGVESYVIPVERPSGHHVAREVIQRAEVMLIQNADFDLAVLEATLGVPLEDTYPRTVDTKVLSQLVDPTGVSKRGADGKIVASHSLKDLARKHIDPDLDIDKALDDEFRRLGFSSGKGRSKAKHPKPLGWKHVPIDNEVYVRYSGLDPILAFRIYEVLRGRLLGPLRPLFGYEHRLSYLLTSIKRRGLLVDRPYTERWIIERREQVAELIAPLAEPHGIVSTAADTDEDRDRVFAFLRARGIEPPVNENGNPSLDKKLLGDVIKEPDKGGDPLVFAFFRARELEKFAKDYAQKFLDLADPNDVIHPIINALGASTGRNSIEAPPLQQMPQLYEVRGCLRARPGYVLVGADFDQVEFKDAASQSGEPNMIKLIRAGVDLHNVTAQRLYGPDFGKPQRTVAKRAGFGRLYGAGRKAVAIQTGVSERTAQRALDAFDANFPGIKAWAKRLGQQTEVVTPLGRRLPIDPQRSYAAVNYAVQSDSRDLFMLAGIRLADAGLGPHLWLPVHDEWIVEVPEQDGEEVANLMTELMTFELPNGVPVTATGEVLGPRWRKGD